jgi:hypothetical protein
MSTKRPRILVVGAGSPNADLVAEVLRNNGMNAEWTDKIRNPNPFFIRRFDLVYGIYLQSCARFILVAKMLRKKTIVHFVGSDAYWLHREQSSLRRFFWSIVLYLNDLVFYVSPHLEKLVGHPGSILPFPIQKAQFTKLPNSQPDRDVLYYCPSGAKNQAIYRLDWILQYAKEHPDEKITIVGSINHPANFTIALPNIEVVPNVARSEMPRFYQRHRALIRMTTEDGLPRMVHEALLCGLTVTFNGQPITDVPIERDPTEFAKSFQKALGLT